MILGESRRRSGSVAVEEVPTPRHLVYSRAEFSPELVLNLGLGFNTIPSLKAGSAPLTPNSVALCWWLPRSTADGEQPRSRERTRLRVTHRLSHPQTLFWEHLKRLQQEKPPGGPRGKF